MANTFQAGMTSILNAAVAASTAGNWQAVGALGSLLHLGASQGHVDYKAKTMTMAWASANPATVPVLEAEGYTIIPD